MNLRWLTIILLVLLFFLQWQLWIGDGSIGQQSQLKREVSIQKDINDGLRARNDDIVIDIESLSDDVADSEGIEANARSRLGMVKDGEVFYMIVEDSEEESNDSSQNDE